MIRYFLLLITIWTCAAPAMASTREELSVSLIPDSLMRGAHSVVRSSDVSLNITSPSTATHTEHTVITVLDAVAANDLAIRLGYDRFIKIKEMHVQLYDKTGKQMNSHHIYDMQDYAAYGDALFGDARVKYLQTGAGEYPVTIDLTVVSAYDGILSYPEWQIQSHGQAVEASTLTVTTPSDLGVNYKAYNTTIQPVITHDKYITYTWTVSHTKARKVPSNSYSSRYYLPRVSLSPTQFEIEGYKGSMATWEALGKAISDMWRDKQKLPESIQEEIKNMVRDAHTDHEKIAILYSYLQKNFRYVSVQVGIGGWIPFDAATVHKTRYGDCKALSNYMCALLHTVGVKAYPVLINAGPSEHAIDTTFPSSRFNHAILCAEADGQPLWLECTSNAMPAGELGTFTENRYGLIIDDIHGSLIHTPASAPEPNQISVSHEVTITAAGVKMTGAIELSGEFRSGAKPMLILGSEKEQMQYIFNGLHVMQPEEITLDRPLDSADHIAVTLHGIKEHIYDFKSNDKSFIASTLITKWYENITTDSAAKYDVLIGFPSDRKEKLVYHLAAGEVSLPADFDLDNKIVSFHRKSVKQADNTVTILTELKTKSNVIHRGDVALFKESLQQVNKYIQQKVVLEEK